MRPQDDDGSDKDSADATIQVSEDEDRYAGVERANGGKGKTEGRKKPAAPAKLDDRVKSQKRKVCS
jgi:hypothetical protein